MHPFIIQRYQDGKIKTESRTVVEECPVTLNINGLDLVTLVASPHQLNFLIIGFLYLQGFISRIEDIETLGVCSEQGVARVRLVPEIPKGLRPTVTTGCGGGISYNLSLPAQAISSMSYSCDGLIELLKQMHEKALKYAEHGGIHSAAIGTKDGLLLDCEDIGRHNTVDRLAGEALFRGLDLRETMLITSGRISSEMVIKAARLGVGLLASRSTPSDQAVKLCQQAGIVLVGYLRGGRFEIFTYPERLQSVTRKQRISGVTGVILAGGESRRMGSDKSLLPLSGARFIDHIYRTFSQLFDEVLIVTNSPNLYTDIPCEKVPDVFRAQGSLAGIHAGLNAANHPRIFVAGCDMPFINPTLVERICAFADSGDIIIPHSKNGYEPLHAVYNKDCLEVMAGALNAGEKRIVSFFGKVRVHEMSVESWEDCDPQELSFRNINTPEEYFHLRLGSVVKSEALKTSDNMSSHNELQKHSG